MHPLLQLLTDLYGQLMAAQARMERLEAQVGEMRSAGAKEERPPESEPEHPGPPGGEPG